ncbi:MAG: hypothetical protein AAI978_00595 [Candidatus Hodgkinia cicadicola]
MVCANTPLELIMGLEVHMQLGSNYKLFSGCLDTLTALDIGLPGSLPIVNLSDVLGIDALASLICSKLSSWLSFTRKGYFCADLATGYQITQHCNPLLGYGVLIVNVFSINGGCRSLLAHIQSVNLEHDTGSVCVPNECKLVSFMRAGVGLLEFVSFPCFSSVLFVKLYLLKLKLSLTCLRVSSCVMSDAEMRYDLNISVSAPLAAYSTRTEVKNLNSLSGLNAIVLYEACVQRTHRDCTKAVEFKTFATLFLRRKELAHEYNRLLEADVPLARVLARQSGCGVCQRVYVMRSPNSWCWLVSYGRFSFFCFLSPKRFYYQAYVLSSVGFSFLSLAIKHALIV